MSSRDEMVDEVLLNLAGYLTDQELMGTLQSAIGPTNSSFVVNGSVFPDGVGFQPGMAELGNGELIYVGEVGSANSGSPGTFSSVIRGYRSSMANDWPAGTHVRANPRVPRSSIIRDMNHTLALVYPDLIQYQSIEIPTNLGVTWYDLPAEATDVIRIDIHDPDQTTASKKSHYWSFETTGNPTATTGKGIQCRDFWHGSILSVLYSSPATAFDTSLDVDPDFSATGLPDYCQEVITAGAAYRAMSMLATGEAASRTAEGDLLGMQGGVKPKAEKLSELLFTLYTQKRMEARDRMRMEANIGAVHYIG